MNLEKLFKMQAELDAHILAEHPVKPGEDRLSKKILALLVELGELANEWRGFKYWSKDQKPRTEKQVICSTCNGEAVWYTGHIEDGLPHTEACDYCHGTGYEIVGNPLLEEYVDCLHFILSIGIDIGYTPSQPVAIKLSSITNQFHEMFYVVTDLHYCTSCINDEFTQEGKYLDVFEVFLGLGEMLGFDWPEIEQAYIQKNQVNHERQAQNY